MCRVPRVAVLNVSFRFWRDECECRPSPVEMVEVWCDPANTVHLTVEAARRNKALWPAIADAYASWARPPVLAITDQRRLRVRVPALGRLDVPSFSGAGSR